jgi:hypothetical protein
LLKDVILTCTDQKGAVLSCVNTVTGASFASCALFSLSTSIPSSDDPCANKTVTVNPNQITGLPDPPKSATDNPLPCPISNLPACSAPTAGTPAADDWLLGSTNGLLVSTSAANTYLATSVQTFWKVAFGLAMALLALPVILAGYQLLLGVSGTKHAEAVALLSRILVVACAAGISYFIISALVTLESGLLTALSTAFPKPSTPLTMPSLHWSDCTQQFFGSIFNLTIDQTRNYAQYIDTATYTSLSSQTTLTLMENLTNYVLTLSSISLFLQLSVRLMLLNFHIIMSPLVIICGALPERLGESAARSWVHGFASLLFVQLLQLVSLWLGGQLVSASFMSGSGWVNEVLAKILPITFLLITLNMPRLVNAPALSLISKASSSFGSTISSFVLIIRGI